MTQSSRGNTDFVVFFKKFCPRFRQAGFEFVGLDEPGWSMDYSNSLLVTLAGRSHFWGAGRFQLHKISLKTVVECKFNPAHGCALDQLKSAFWNAFRKEHLSSLRLLADPDPSSLQNREFLKGFLLKEDVKNDPRSLGVILSCNRGEIPGLEEHDCFRAEHWSFFIPSASPEGKTLEVAIRLGRMKEAIRLERESKKKEVWNKKKVEEMQRSVEEALLKLL